LSLSFSCLLSPDFLMQELPEPKLRIGRCFADSFSVWVNHIPLLFVTSILAVALSVLTATLFMGSLYAGLLIILLKGMRGEKPVFKDLFSQFRRFLRFFSISLFILLIVVLSLAILVAPLIIFQNETLLQVQEELKTADIHLNLGALLQLAKLPGVSIVAVVVGFFFLVLPGLFFVVKCFYMYLLAADRGVHLDEAYVESRKAVQRYGFRKHLFLMVAALAILIGSDILHQQLDSVPLTGLLPVLFQPFSLGLFVSAYRQTLEAEATRLEMYQEQFKLMRNELQTAHDMQMGLLPQQNPELSDFRLDGTCIPANNVGGDYFTYRWLDPEKTLLAIVVADVSGKAMEAAVTALRFNEMLRYECRDRTEPADILDGLNNSLEGQIETSTFITCCIAVLDTVSGTLKVSSAGHCPPYRYRSRDQRPIPIPLAGLPLGLSAIVRPDEPYDTVELQLDPGDLLVIYTDGVVEAQNRNRDLYDEEQLELLLKSTAPGADAGRMVRTIVRDVENFIGDAPRTDDITVVILQHTPAIPPDQETESAAE